MQSHPVAPIGYAVSQVARYPRYRRNAATFEPIPNLCRPCCHTPERKMTLTPLSCR
jgi:hypothetical protein